MKITQTTTQIKTIALPRPIVTAIHHTDALACVLLRIRTDQGITGESYLFALHPARIKAYDEILRAAGEQLVGRSPQHVGAIWDDLWHSFNPYGRHGITVAALSAIDIACWDIIGKALDAPLHRVFGACRERVKTYASGGLWLSQSEDELIADAEQFLREGFRAMKIRVGYRNIDADVMRVRLVREIIGFEAELMADVNQGLSAKDAIRLARRLEDYQLSWLEEPVAAGDWRGHARVTAASDTPIASGENIYGSIAMQQFIAADACDIITPDLQRIGGYTEMLRVAALAHANQVPFSTHMFTEHSLCIAGAAAGCVSVEHMPWFAALFAEEMEMQDGYILIPQRPGTGFGFAEW